MTELEEELRKVLHEYYPLLILSPKNELLKYFIFDKNGFRENQNEEIKIEFLEKFRGDFPKIDDLKKRGVGISLLKYGRELVSSLLQNYYNALKKELEASELKN